MSEIRNLEIIEISPWHLPQVVIPMLNLNYEGSVLLEPFCNRISAVNCEEVVTTHVDNDQEPPHSAESVHVS